MSKKRVVSEYFEEIRDCFLNNQKNFRYDYGKLVLSKGFGLTFTFLPLGENKVEVECTKREPNQIKELKLLSATIDFDEKTYKMINDMFQSIKTKYEEIDQYLKTQQLADLLYKF